MNWWPTTSLMSFLKGPSVSDAPSRSLVEPLTAEENKEPQHVSREAAPVADSSSEASAPGSTQPFADLQKDATTAVSSVEVPKDVYPVVTGESQQDSGTDLAPTRDAGTLLSSATLPADEKFRRGPPGVTSDSATASELLEDAEGGPLPVFSSRLRRLLGPLIEKHTEVLAVRVSVEESGSRVKIKRRDLEQVDVQYMTDFEHFLSKNDSILMVPNLRNDFAKLQVARVELRTLEEEHEREEDYLFQVETQFRNLQAQVYDDLIQTDVRSDEEQAEDASDLVSSQEPRIDPNFSRGEAEANLSPEARLYLSQLGDVNILKERLLDKDIEFIQVTEENALREEIGLPLEVASEQFLATFEVEREALASQLKDTERALADLAAYLNEREQLPTRYHLFQDLERTPESPEREHSLFEKDDYYDDDIVERDHLADGGVMAYAKELLLSQADSQLVYENVTIDADGEYVDKASYINSWQLNRLRRSTREVARLVQILRDKDVQLASHELKTLVLRTWMRDETVQSIDYSRFTAHPLDYSAAACSSLSRPSRPVSDLFEQAQERNRHPIHRSLSFRHAETR